MIQGTTPIIYMAFGVDIGSLAQFKIIFEQEGKENLVKTQDNCQIDTENNVAYLKLSQEETLEFDTSLYVKIQVKALTNDGNVIASQIVTDTFCPILDTEIFEGATNDITPIDTNKISIDFSNSSCGFGVDFGNMIVYQELPADKQLSSTSKNAVENRVVTENFARVDNEFLSVSKRADEIEAIARGASKGKVYYDYQEMIEALSNAPRDFLKTPDHIFLRKIDIPDLWVAYVENYYNSYSFESEEKVINDLKTLGYITVGYFSLCMLETQKVDLTDYAKKYQVPVITATQKENGAYTLTITMGVE